MAIPKYYEFFPAVINCLSDGEIHSSREIREFCITAFNLSEEDCREQLDSGQSVISNRVGWAQTYLKKADLIESPQRGKYVLTNLGKQAWEQGSEKITLDYLNQYKNFRDFKFDGENQQEGKEPVAVIDFNENSPEEMIEYAMSQLNSSLADSLMVDVMKMTPYEFEDLVVKLLVKMGYGSTDLTLNTVTKKSGDEGIDGIVTADRLGFDTIFTQAKQWKPDSTVGRPDIQKFLGALAGRGVAKGIFITTAKFSNEAKEYVAKQLLQKIVLIDGKKLMELMIEYNLGVSVVKTYSLKRVDSDFFTEE